MSRLVVVVLVLGPAVVLTLAVGCGRQINPEWCAQPGHSDPACRGAIDAGADAALVDAALIDAAPGDASCLDGGCTEADETLYAAPLATGRTCTIDDKCLLATALGLVTPTRDVIQLAPGDYPGPIRLAQSVRIVGNRATIRGTAVGSALDVIAGVVVELTDMTITGAVNGSGLSCVGSTLRADHLEIFGNKQGITSGCALTLRQSRIHSHPGGALSMTVGPIDVHDNFFVKNGTDSLAGVSNVVIGPGLAGAFELNTVAYNETKQNTVAGVDCQSTAVSLVGNLITDNRQKSNFNVAQVTAGCNFAGSYTASSTTGNDVKWADPAALDFHLTDGSLLVLDKVPAAACASQPAYDHDYDGDARPPDRSCDFGADEH